LSRMTIRLASGGLEWSPGGNVLADNNDANCAGD
jgi:hypothetical protein